MKGFSTGVELSAGSCVLVKIRRGQGSPRLSALHIIDAAEWPAQESTAADVLRQVRREKRFPRRAFVVGWMLPESASITDPGRVPALRPLLDAGFVIEAITTPARALGMLAGERAGPSTPPTAWLALARHGAAIAIVRGADVLYSRALEWRYRAATRPREQLLQRYSLVAHLAPELKHGIEVVRAEHNIQVSHAVTCGDLPDLRSLTMPLIEELDLEVEALDSLDGLELLPSARRDRAVEYAAALRLACAVTVLPAVRDSRGNRSWLRPVAAGLAVAAGGLWGLPKLPLASRPRSTEPVAPHLPAPAATSGASQPDKPPVPVASVPNPAGGSSRTDVPQNVPDTYSENVPASFERAAPLADPLPVVHSILVAADRRLAVLDGTIVAEGDLVGRRRVARIEPEAVVLREPSGREIRTGIRRLKQAPRL